MGWGVAEAGFSEVQELEATVWRHGKKYWQKFERGKALGDVGVLALEEGEGVRSGTQIVFRPDPTSECLGVNRRGIRRVTGRGGWQFSLLALRSIMEPLSPASGNWRS